MVLNFLFGDKKERARKSAEKFGNVLKNKITTKEQRLEAIDGLLSIDDPEIVVPQLMKRFSIVVDSGIQDKREKEICMDHIVGLGSAALPYIEEALKTAERVAWPIRMVQTVYDENRCIELFLGALSQDVLVFDDHVNARNCEIILALKDYSNEKIVDPVAGFLTSRDESVRMAALECLETQAQASEKAKALIKDVLNQESHDGNSRFLGVVKTMVEKNGW